MFSVKTGRYAPLDKKNRCTIIIPTSIKPHRRTPSLKSFIFYQETGMGLLQEFQFGKRVRKGQRETQTLKIITLQNTQLQQMYISPLAESTLCTHTHTCRIEPSTRVHTSGKVHKGRCSICILGDRSIVLR